MFQKIGSVDFKIKAVGEKTLTTEVTALLKLPHGVIVRVFCGGKSHSSSGSDLSPQHPREYGTPRSLCQWPNVHNQIR
ncbi:MAG: hypothetical protein KBI01_08385 [Oscillospiraceae bacterium]|nr:hypothetical protein [Oscillospiraceae bacterium]